MENSNMTKKTFSTFAIALMLLIAADAVATEKVILHFNGTNGGNPTGALIADAKGNLYGTSTSGGSNNCNSSPCFGLVFELSPVTGGGWTETIIHVFSGADGANPAGALLLDGKGNLYGTTAGGSLSPYGLAFELSPQANGSWTETVLHTFTGGQDGNVPHGAIALDAQGNLYGSTNGGGANNSGVVYELSPQSNGTWTEAILHAFGGSGDTGVPFGGVTMDSHGNLFGSVTSGGGTNNLGAVYELVPNGSGQWTETIIHSFSTGDGASPQSPLALDSSGNLYGTTLNEGGAFRYGGTVFKLSPGSGGTWTYSVLHAFGKGNDGYDATAVTLDAKGNLYGTTTYGGSGCYQGGYGGCGVVFTLTPQSSGLWKESIVHTFESVLDGSQSAAGVLIDKANGNIYGTTQVGGSRLGFGTVFEIHP
jgi:uncharacterized repeat protein (TIGR03803 family)